MGSIPAICPPGAAVQRRRGERVVLRHHRMGQRGPVGRQLEHLDVLLPEREFRYQTSAAGKSFQFPRG
jgi:hypothetical protein